MAAGEEQSSGHQESSKVALRQESSHVTAGKRRDGGRVLSFVTAGEQQNSVTAGEGQRSVTAREQQSSGRGLSSVTAAKD